jgi:acetylornithine deacetylase/succinyl-diaminopimelate desuccinylase-like protein
MKRGWMAAFAALLALPANAQDLRPDQRAFRALYQELVETNTTLSAGSCTLAAQKMAAHLKGAGYPDSDLHFFSVPDHPKEGGLVAVLPGSDPKAKAILLLAHLDVVEAKREDWTRDPFKLVEEGGYFYGRGTADDKSLAAVWVDTMARFKQDHVAHNRSLKLALTCGEETNGAFNGAEYLSKNQRSLIDAEFGLTEGGWGTMDEKGKRIALNINAGEKLSQNYTLEVTNPGGHSMRPVKDNAIYHLSQGLARLAEFDFPVSLNETMRGYFERTAALESPATGADFRAVIGSDHAKAEEAAKRLSQSAFFNALLRTTCVATRLEGGHANNALPQTAAANVNCRMLPQDSLQNVQDTLKRVLADDRIAVTVVGEAVPAPASAINPAIVSKLRSLSAKLYGGLPIVPVMDTGASDGKYLRIAGIPTYGVPGVFEDVDDVRAHGKDERIGVKDFYDGVDFYYEFIKSLGTQ